MRHHRKLLRRLRATYPVTDRRGVVVERTPSGWWRVIAGRVVIGSRRGRIMVLDEGDVLARRNRRCDALQEALRRARGALT